MYLYIDKKTGIVKMRSDERMDLPQFKIKKLTPDAEQEEKIRLNYRMIEKDGIITFEENARQKDVQKKSTLADLKERAENGEKIDVNELLNIL